MTDYDADPSLIDTALQLSEVEELRESEGRGLLKDARKLSHFLHRVEATLTLRNEQITELKKELSRLHSEQQRAGTPTTLSPLDAVRYLTDDQRALLFDEFAQQQLATLQRERATAAEVRKKSLQFAGRVRYELIAIAEEPHLSAAIRSRVEQLIANIGTAGVGEPPPDAAAPSAATVGVAPSPEEPADTRTGSDPVTTASTGPTGDGFGTGRASATQPFHLPPTAS